VLYNLTASDGTGPVSLALGPEGSLFGATVTDPPANAGTIFEVTPPASGTGSLEWKDPLRLNRYARRSRSEWNSGLRPKR